jgi:hypothetical protein
MKPLDTVSNGTTQKSPDPLTAEVHRRTRPAKAPDNGRLSGTSADASTTALMACNDYTSTLARTTRCYSDGLMSASSVGIN